MNINPLRTIRYQRSLKELITKTNNSGYRVETAEGHTSHH